jgi:hypothetical protein
MTDLPPKRLNATNSHRDVRFLGEVPDLLVTTNVLPELRRVRFEETNVQQFGGSRVVTTIRRTEGGSVT